MNRLELTNILNELGIKIINGHCRVADIDRVLEQSSQGVKTKSGREAKQQHFREKLLGVLKAKVAA